MFIKALFKLFSNENLTGSIFIMFQLHFLIVEWVCDVTDLKDSLLDTLDKYIRGTYTDKGSWLSLKFQLKQCPFRSEAQLTHCFLKSEYLSSKAIGFKRIHVLIGQVLILLVKWNSVVKYFIFIHLLKAPLT
jgi:hypothetical protein